MLSNLLKYGHTVIRFYPLAGIIALLGSLGCLNLGECNADLVEVQYWDQGFANPATNGGPLWTGVVDTVTNNLRIDTWEERPGHGADYLVPAALPNTPLIWKARNSSGGVYDVPDGFGPTVGGTVTIDDNFGFFSSVTAQQMNWVYDIDGPGGAPPQSRTIGPVPKPTLIGWGGFARQETLNGPFVYYTSALSGDDPYNERSMPRLPIEPASGTVTNSFLASEDATVLVTGRTVTSVGTIFAVPEPSAFFCVGLVAAVSSASLRRNRSSRRR